MARRAADGPASVIKRAASRMPIIQRCCGPSLRVDETVVQGDRDRMGQVRRIKFRPRIIEIVLHGPVLHIYERGNLGHVLSLRRRFQAQELFRRQRETLGGERTYAERLQAIMDAE